MQQFKTRNDLLSWLENNCPREAIAFAMVTGKIELLGGFDPAPGSSNPGWVVKVTSKWGLHWYIVIVLNKLRHKYNVYTVKDINWKNWVGFNSMNALYQGDNLEDYKRLIRKEFGE